jgi:hypothetical protein
VILRVVGDPPFPDRAFILIFFTPEIVFSVYVCTVVEKGVFENGRIMVSIPLTSA